MPNYKLSDVDASDISAYLVSTSTTHAGDTAALGTKPAANADPSAGRAVWRIFLLLMPRSSECRWQLGGGDLGPELTRLGNKVKPEWLTAWLQNPRIYDATTPMRSTLHPAADHDSGCFSPGQNGLRLRSSVHLDVASPPQIAHGRKLIVELGCAACMRSTACRSRKTLRLTSALLEASLSRRLSFRPAWNTRCPVTSSPRSVSRAPSAQREDAAVCSDGFADRCFDHGPACAHESQPHHARQLRVAATPETTTSLPGTRAS